MNNFRFFISLVAIIAVLNTNCSDDPADEMANISFGFDFRVGGEELILGNVYEINNTAVSFSVAHYYIGGLVLTLDNAAQIDLSSSYILAGTGSTFYVDGSFAASDVVKTDFYIGVDPVTNAQSEIDFTARDAGDPLGIKDPAMHWNWNTGYKFVRFDGNADSDGDGVVDTPIAYHIGTDALLTNFTSSERIDLRGGDNDLYFTIDLEEFFNGVDLSTEHDTHTGNNLPLAQKLVSNMSSAISIR